MTVRSKRMSLALVFEESGSRSEGSEFVRGREVYSSRGTRLVGDVEVKWYEKVMKVV